MDRETRLKRLKIRAWRRGTKEMDLILGQYCDALGEKMSSDELDHLEDLMNENDQDLYAWVAGQSEPPAKFAQLIQHIALHSGADQGAR